MPVESEDIIPVYRFVVGFLEQDDCDIRTLILQQQGSSRDISQNTQLGFYS